MCVCVQVDEVIKPKVVVVVCQTKVLVCKAVCSSTKDKLWCGVVYKIRSLGEWGGARSFLYAEIEGIHNT